MNTIRAPRGPVLRAKGWRQEAALRMLMNNLDPDVAERPEELIVSGGAGKAVRDWPSYHAIVRELEQLKNDETLLVQSGKPVGVFPTHNEAPRVLIANSDLAGQWSNWEHFRTLERLGLIMCGQMTTGGWIYIGSQGILQGTYETFAAAARKHFGGSLSGKLVSYGGIGGMDGAQTLAATLNGARFLGTEVDPDRIARRIESGYGDVHARSLDDALGRLREAADGGKALSVGLTGSCTEVLQEMVRRGIVPDLLTDQTGAHDPLNGYVPAGLDLRAASALRASDPDEHLRRSMDSIPNEVRAMLDLKRQGGAITFDSGNNIRHMAGDRGVPDAFEIPGFVPEHIRPMFAEGRGPFRWVALSGEAEALRDGSDAVADWPILNALLNTAVGASWDSVHNCGGVGIGYSLHAGQVTVADGTLQAARCLERVMTCDPGIGVLRQGGAGYEDAANFARQAGLRTPMQ